MKVDQQRMLGEIDAKIAATSNPRHRAPLKTVREHVSAELDGRDLNRIMNTLCPDPQYHFWGAGIGDFGPKGREAVAAFYKKFLDDGYNKHQHLFERIVVDDNNVVLDGEMRIVFPGKALRGMGLQVDDADASYLFSYRAAAIFSFDDDGKCLCEDSYSDGLPTLERLIKLKPEEVPERITA